MPYKYKILAGFALFSLIIASSGVLTPKKEYVAFSENSIQQIEALNQANDFTLHALGDINSPFEKELLAAQLLDSERQGEEMGLLAATENREIFVLQPAHEMSEGELEKMARLYAERVPEFNSVELDQSLELNAEDIPEPTWLGNTLEARRGSVTTKEWRPAAPEVDEDLNITPKIAVLDSGVEEEHPVFNTALLEDGWDAIQNKLGAEDDLGHGTHVTAIITREAPGADVIPYKIISKDGGGRLSNVIVALQKALEDDVDIINMSFGFTEPSEALKALIDDATSKGVVFVAASGNKKEGAPFYPAYYEEVIAVGSATEEAGTYETSNYGDWVDVAGLGRLVRSATLNDEYGYKSGTSQATAFVTAYLANLMEAGELGHADHDNLMDILNAVETKVLSGKLQGLSLIR